jgi:actin-related protein
MAEGRGSMESRDCRMGQECRECREMTAGARRKGAAGVARPALGRRKVTRTLGRGSETRADGRGDTRSDEPLLTPSQSSGVEVNVISHKRQRYAVWYGGSLMASTVSPSLEFESHESPKPHLLQLSHPFFERTRWR